MSEQLKASCVLSLLEASVYIYENLHVVLLPPRRLHLSPLSFKCYLASVLCFYLEIQLSTRIAPQVCRGNHFGQ